MEQLLRILALVAPVILNLIKSKAIPAIKRRIYEKTNNKIDSLIEDLAQNASKIKNEEDENKKLAYIEGTKLGIEALYVIADKINKAAQEIEKAL